MANNPVFQFLNPQPTTIARLIEISGQDRNVQNEYVQRIQLHRIPWEGFNELRITVGLLDHNIRQENVFREMLEAALAEREVMLQREEQRTNEAA